MKIHYLYPAIAKRISSNDFDGQCARVILGCHIDSAFSLFLLKV